MLLPAFFGLKFPNLTPSFPREQLLMLLVESPAQLRPFLGCILAV